MGNIINTAEEAARKKAIQSPHGFFFVDQLLQAKTDGYQAQFTIGWETPTGAYAPVATACLPVPFLRVLADALLAMEEEAAQKRQTLEARKSP